MTQRGSRRVQTGRDAEHCPADQHSLRRSPSNRKHQTGDYGERHDVRDGSRSPRRRRRPAFLQTGDRAWGVAERECRPVVGEGLPALNLYSMESVTLAFLVTLAAGLCTGIGSTIAFFTRHTNRAFLSLALGFSAGAMIYVSFVEILPKARTSLLAAGNSELRSVIVSTIGFFAGMILIAAMDRLLARFSNPHEGIPVELMENAGGPGDIHRRASLGRMGVLIALAVALHNFPEGLGTFLVLLEDPAVGLALAAAIAIHNIPEGVAISVPLYHATGKRSKAFLYSFASGLAEPLGALTGYLVLRPFIDETTFGILFAGVAGIMVFISVDQLLPAAREYGRPNLEIYGLMAGMAVMATSLVLFTL